jgi:hypothetical protein
MKHIFKNKYFLQYAIALIPGFICAGLFDFTEFEWNRWQSLYFYEVGWLPVIFYIFAKTSIYTYIFASIAKFAFVLPFVILSIQKPSWNIWLCVLNSIFSIATCFLGVLFLFGSRQ